MDDRIGAVNFFFTDFKCFEELAHHCLIKQTAGMCYKPETIVIQSQIICHGQRKLKKTLASVISMFNIPKILNMILI